MDGTPDVFFNVHMSEMPDFGDPKYVDVWADDVVTLSLQYSTQWDSLAHVGAEFDADGDGVEEAVYYNGYRAGTDLVGPSADARGDGSGHRGFARHLGLEHMAFHGVQGRGVLVDLAHHLGHDWKAVDLATLQEVMDADGVVVEPGDVLLLHTGFATEILGMDRNPDPRKIFTLCCYLDAHDPSLLEWIADSQIAGARGRQLRSRGPPRQGPGPEPPLVPADPPPLPVRARRPARRALVPRRAGDLAPRARPQPLPPHRTPAPPPRHRRLPGDPIATV